MRLIEEGEKVDFLPDNTVKGVELNGRVDALLLVQSLGRMAYETLGPDASEAIKVIGGPNGQEALRLQLMLLDTLSRDDFSDGPFLLEAVDPEPRIEDLFKSNPLRNGFAGRIIRSAVEGALQVS